MKISVPESFEAYIIKSKKKPIKNNKHIRVPSLNISEKRVVKKKPEIIVENSTIKKKKTSDVYSRILNKIK